MKTLLLTTLLLGLNFQNAFSVEKEELAVVRGKKGKLVEKTVTLKDLNNSLCLDGANFKIVLGKSKKPICFDLEDKKLLLKAVTTYHHLTIAKDYFLNNFMSEQIKGLEQIVIRVDMDLQFHEIGHFGNENLPKEYNNALSIPAGTERIDWGIEAWGQEIWFRPAKKVKVPVDLNGAERFLPGLNGIKNKGFKNAAPVVLTALAYAFRFNGYSATGMDYSNLFDVVRSMAVMETTFWGVKGGIKLLSKRKATLKLDSAFIPEIIYHEYAHLALSNSMKLSHSTAVNEGIADYFAAAISKSPHLAKKIKKYSKADGKNANNKALYSAAYEMTEFASIDFVLGVFWKVRKALPGVADRLIYNASARLSTNSSIKDDMLRAILDECRITCTNPVVDRYKLFQVFHKKGF